MHMLNQAYATKGKENSKKLWKFILGADVAAHERKEKQKAHGKV